MSHIFLSYSRKDEDKAITIARDLQNAGFNIWTDHAILLGQSWTETLQKALHDASGMLVLLSPNAPYSAWIEDEVRKGADYHKPIVTALIEGEPAMSIPDALQGIPVTSVDARGNVDSIIEALRTIQV